VCVCVCVCVCVPLGRERERESAAWNIRFCRSSRGFVVCSRGGFRGRERVCFRGSDPRLVILKVELPSPLPGHAEAAAWLFGALGETCRRRVRGLAACATRCTLHKCPHVQVHVRSVSVPPGDRDSAQSSRAKGGGLPSADAIDDLAPNAPFELEWLDAHLMYLSSSIFARIKWTNSKLSTAFT